MISHTSLLIFARLGGKAPCRHSTLESAQEHVTAMIKAGVPRKKLVLGIPAYAREMNKPQEVRTYDEVRPLCCVLLIDFSGSAGGEAATPSSYT